FEHTGQGVARTHELMLNFDGHPRARPIEEVSSLVQRPVAVRQSPASAMAVPYRGMKIPPASQDPEHADMERAIDQVGRFTFARWQSLHDYGVWRYGKTRFNAPSEGFNRWYDNMQYNQQEMPLLLWMRGGDRRYFEEGHTLSRYAIDVNLNHHTSVAGARPGYGSGAAGLPIPWNRLHIGFETKLNFLALYYHLTGYRPALEILATASRSLLAELDQLDPTCPAVGITSGPFDRSLYNTFGMLLTAYEEKEILDLSIEEQATLECWLGELSRKIKTREYRDFFEQGNSATDPLSSFRSPHYFLFENLVHFQDLAPDTPLEPLLSDSGNLRAIMLEALAARGWPGLGQAETSLVPAPNFTNYAAALGWAFEETLS
ncbi:MAG: hypothetical protein MI919_02390, partial [Holophagales bacterium]|nr:hypothetical protein [Holophagales bacterium]